MEQATQEVGALATVIAGQPGLNRSRLVRRFIEICRADSAPLKEGPVFRIVAGALEELGLSVWEDGAAKALGGEVGNLVATLPGRGAPAASSPLLFCAHMDRVAGGVGVQPVVNDGVITSGGNTILGADDAAGLAAIIEAVHVLVESGSDRVPIEIVCTIGEEAGLVGAKSFDVEILRSRCGFVLDAEGEVGTIVCRAPTQASIRAELFGRSAHAGLAPEEGISAIKMAAAAISKMNLGRIDHETTANVGYIAGGGPTNVVPERAEIRAEARSLDDAKLDRQLAHMQSVLVDVAARFGGKVEWNAWRNYEGFALDADSEPVRRASAAIVEAGLEPKLLSTGGGSDANVFNARGVPSAVLGVGYQGIHTHMERMPIAELVRLTEVVLRLMQGAGCP